MRHQIRSRISHDRSGQPGTWKSKHRAVHLLTAQRIKPGLWLVTGGETGHGVTIENGVYKCDCPSWSVARDQFCSHCWAVRLAIQGEEE